MSLNCTNKMEGEVPNEHQVTQTTAEEVDNVFNSDSVYLRQILPEEMWKFVTDNLLKRNPDNVDRLINASPFFRKLLSSQITVQKFDKVFQLVTSSVWTNEGLVNLPVSEIFKCRVICSKWNATIDKLIPEKFLHFGEMSNNISLTTIGVMFEDIVEENNWFTNSLTWSTEKTVERFLSHFEHTHLPANLSRNPLIWDNLSVKVCYDGEDEWENYVSYLDNITLLLTKYGHYIRNFSLDIDKDNFLDEGLRLQEWFSLMPNLKVLTFESECPGQVEHNLDYYQQDYLLQKINNLHTLEIKGIPPPLFDQLVKQNSHITTLIVSYWHVRYYFFLEPLPNLKNLEIEFGSPLILAHIWLVRWPLETLTITIGDNDFDNSDFIEFADLLPVIEGRFGTTLVSLDLSMTFENEEAKKAIYEECKTGKLCLSNLKKIRLALSEVLVCLDFLMGMKDNLEEISVYVGYKYPVVKEDIEATVNTVQFIGFEDKMLESNVWKIFEKLKKFKVTARWAGMTHGQERVYSRQDCMLNHAEQPE